MGIAKTPDFTLTHAVYPRSCADCPRAVLTGRIDLFAERSKTKATAKPVFHALLGKGATAKNAPHG
ncbi:MAG: hypothetical protein ACREUA_03950 [Burkholderiales bacterium]